MHIVFYPRVPTSEERKKERKKERFLSISFVFSQKAKRKKFHSIPFVINKTRFYTHARIEHTHEIVLSARSTGIVFGTSSSVFSSRLCGQPERVEVRYLKLEFKTP